jgi:hypothetical protein
VWNDGDLTLDGVVIRQTGTDFTGAAGGGICNSGTLRVTNSTLTGNGSKQGGAILNGPTGTVTIRNSTLSKNNISGSTPEIGTAILNRGVMTITDSTIAENTFNNGVVGAIVSNGGTISIANSIVSFNGTSHLPQVHNCEGLPLISLGHNLDDDGTCGFTAAGDLSNIPSRLGPLSDNGGPTPTHLPLIGSQVIDAGAGCLATDQRGVARPRDGNGNGTALCDIGAVEGPARGVLQFSGATYNLAEAGATASITVTRINGAEGPASATVSMTNGTATAPADYDATSLPVAFADGDSTAKMVQVSIVDDPNDEPDETVNLALGPVNAANIGTPASAVLTISDNDNPPSLFIGDVSIAEGDAGPVSAEFPVTLSVVSGFTVTVVAQTTDGTAAAASGDYQAAGPDSLTFAPGTTTQPFTVQVNADAIDELNETFAVNLSAPMNATIADNQGQGTITDDDVPGSLGFSATVAQVAENDGIIILTVQRGGVNPSGAGPPAANVPSGSVRPKPVASPVPD